MFFPALEVFDSLNCRPIERIGAQAVEGIGAESDDAAAFDRVADSRQRGVICSRNNHGVSAPLGAKYLS